MKIKLELEIRNREAIWNVKSTHYYNDFKSVTEKIKQMKKAYALHNKDYKFYVTIPSKLNDWFL